MVGKDKFNLAHGSILGITHDFFNVLSFRPQSRHPSIKSAYFVGASAHPGTGVPIAIAGSRLCAEAVLSDLGIPTPACYTTQASFPIRKPTDELDKPQPRWIRHRLEELIGMIWNHLALLVIITLVGLLVATGTEAGRSISNSSPHVPIFSKGATMFKKVDQAETLPEAKTSSWTDNLQIVGLVVAFLVIKFFRGERAGVAAAAT